MINRRDLFSKAVAAPSVIALAARNSRGGLLLGTAALAQIIATERALADQNYTSFAYNATGGSTPRTSPDRWADILNILDFGAVSGGSASTNRTAIQACLDAAFGSSAAPHDNADGVNKAVFFPKGVFTISDYIQVTSVWGGKIFGQGAKQSVVGISSIPSVAAEGWRPLFWLNGCNFCIIDGFSFSAPADTTTLALTSISNASPAVFTRTAHGLTDGDPITLTTTGTLPAPLVPTSASKPPIYYVVNSAANTFQVAYVAGGTPVNTTSAGSGTHSYVTHRTVCLWFGPDGAAGGSSAHGNTISNVSTFNANYGYIHGSANSAANSENTYLDCYGGFHDIGILASGANTLNMRWIGGGFSFCNITGFKTNNSATIPFIAAPALDANVCDFDFAASGHTAIIGVRTESSQVIRTNGSAALIDVSQAFNGGNITASTSGLIMTVTAIVGAYPIVPGQVIDGGGITAKTRVLAQLTGTPGSTGTYLLSNSSSIASTTFARYPVWGEVTGAASMNLNCCGSPYNPVIIGDSSGGSLWIENNQFYDQNAGGISAKLLSFYTGQVHKYDVAGFGQYLVAGLPAAAASLKGLHMFVTDSTVAASGNFGAIVAGGSTNTVPVFCDGTNWRIG